MKFIESSQFKSILDLNETLNRFKSIDLYNDYRVSNPIQFFNNQGGTNWDYCIAESYQLVNELNIPSVCCYSLEIEDDFINFVVFKNEFNWYWFESFDKDFCGIHEFNSWIRMINFIISTYGKKYNSFRLGLRQINPLDNNVFGMDINSYKNYILKSPVIQIHDTKIENPSNYINDNGIMKEYSDTTLNGIDYEGNDGVETKTLAEDCKRDSFNFTRDMKLLKTRSMKFSSNRRWDTFVRRFTANNMADSIMQRIQDLKIKSRMAIDPQERLSFMNEAIELQRTAQEQGYLDQVQFYSTNNATAVATATPEKKTPNQDTYVTKASGDLSNLGQQGDMIIPEVMKKKMQKDAELADQQNQQQQSVAQDNTQAAQQQQPPAPTVPKPPRMTMKKMVKNMAKSYVIGNVVRSGVTSLLGLI